MPADLLKSTPFRMALLLSAIFILALGLSAVVAGYVIRQELSRRLDATISDTYDIISQSLGDSDITDLVDSVQSFSRATLGHEAGISMPIMPISCRGSVCILRHVWCVSANGA